MKARLYDPADYATVKDWWPAHGWPVIAETILPKSGCVVTDDAGVILAAAWLFMSNSNGVSMMEFTVTNPKNTGKQSYAAISILLGAIRALAVSQDYGYILTTSNNPALIRLYEKGGFEVTDRNVTHLIQITKPITPPPCPS